jgi:hypothetical protein
MSIRGLNLLWVTPFDYRERITMASVTNNITTCKGPFVEAEDMLIVLMGMPKTVLNHSREYCAMNCVQIESIDMQEYITKAEELSGESYSYAWSDKVASLWFGAMRTTTAHWATRLRAERDAM